MYRKLESMGSKMLARLVPNIEAGACGTWGWRYYSYCDRCEGPCKAWCATGCGCRTQQCT